MNTRKTDVWFPWYTGIWLWLWCAALPSVAGQPEMVIYFYNPESNIDNFAALKTKFDAYLGQSGNWQFQPFSDRETFETLIGKQKNVVMILSGWHYAMLQQDFALTPHLIGTIAGKTTRQKALYTKNYIDSLEKLRGLHIASAGSREYTRSFLSTLLGREHRGLVDSLRILDVPKDADALMSVRFGLAEAALTTENSLTLLETLYPQLGSELISLAQHPVLLPIVAIHGNRDNEMVKLLDTVTDMTNHPAGRELLNILAIDGWKEPGISELKRLKP